VFSFYGQPKALLPVQCQIAGAVGCHLLKALPSAFLLWRSNTVARAIGNA
jgi:hypothetical protein